MIISACGSIERMIIGKTNSALVLSLDGPKNDKSTRKKHKSPRIWLYSRVTPSVKYSLRKCMKIPPKSFVTRFNDFGRVSFNGKFYQSLLILQAFIFMSRKHSIRFEFIFYSILFLFIAYFANIYFYKNLPSWNFHLENQIYFLWFNDLNLNSEWVAGRQKMRF